MHTELIGKLKKMGFTANDKKILLSSCLFQEHRPDRLTEKLKAEFLKKYEKLVMKGFCEVSRYLELSK